jgi:hypothetical protein
MSQTVAGILVDALEKIGVTHNSASLPTRLTRSPTLSATAKLNGLASVTRKGRHLRLRARPSSPVGSACVSDQPGPAAPISSPASMRQVATTRRF